MEDRLLFDKYQVIRQLGQGGTSTVLLAEHLRLQSLRIIKIISKTQTFYLESIQEISILKNLKHSNIPIIYDIEEDEENAYIIEEYLKGDTLTIFRLNQNELKEELLIQLSIQICEVIQFLHSRDTPILYLDLKPNNIIVSGHTIKLIDFGTAVYKNMVDQRKVSLGSLYFASPEQMKQSSVDERSDIYGIGMILYFLVTGYEFVKQREEGKHIEELSHCSRELGKIINCCLNQNPFRRYQTVNQLLTVLSAMKDGRRQAVSSKKSLTISLAGSQSRIGTTHVALTLTSYFNQTGIPCVYQEKNEHNTIRTLVERYKGVSCQNGIYKLYSCYLQPNYSGSICFPESIFPCSICDMGILDENQLEEFFQADIQLLLVGGKEWELGAAEHAVKILNKAEKVQYLFNFLEGTEYFRMAENMKEKSCCRVPYIPDPFVRKMDMRIELFAEQILGSYSRQRKRFPSSNLLQNAKNKLDAWRYK